MLFAEHFGFRGPRLIPSYADYMRYHSMAKDAFDLAAANSNIVGAVFRMSASMSQGIFQPLLETTGAKLSACGKVINDYSQDPKTLPLDLHDVTIDGMPITVEEDVILDKSFGNVIHLSRSEHNGTPVNRIDPKVLILVPHSGHDMSLLEDTIKTFIPNHEVYIGRFKDADHVPFSEGAFSFHDAIDYYQEYFEAVGQHDDNEQKAHVVAVCQPGPAALLSLAKMSQEDNPDLPHSLTAHASPFDTRINPTKVNEYAHSKPLSWFEENVISKVPEGYGLEGEGRDVYWKYLQRLAFITPNMDSHIQKMKEYFLNVFQGDEDDVEKHGRFIDRYFGDIVSLDAGFYLETVKYVFQDDTVARNDFKHHEQHLDLESIADVAICAIEGENDDITGLGQCAAVLDMTPNVPESLKSHHIIPGTGHFGNWSGKTGRNVLKDIDMGFIRTHDPHARRLSPLTSESQTSAKDAPHLTPEAA